MAQGFVKNLNLVESATASSDAGIVNNLGGVGIADDLRLFDGNKRFRSRLLNNPELNGVVSDYGFFAPDLVYKILIVGESRDWTSVGWEANNAEYGTGEEPQEGDKFLCIDSGNSLSGTGTGGVAVNIVNRQDISSRNDPVYGWIAIANSLDAKVAFVDGTRLILNDESEYNYEVFNSDGVYEFQLKNILTDETLDLSDISNISLIRDDTIEPINIQKLIVKSGSAGSSLGGDVTEDGSLDTDFYPDPFSRIPNIEQIVSDINYKKKNVILTYQNNVFAPTRGVGFGGVLTASNLPVGNYPVKVGMPTPFGELVPEQKYRIVSLGSGANWTNAGAGIITSDAPQVSSGSFEHSPTNIVYSIADLGVDARGTDGAFTFGVGDIDGVTREIDLGNAHNLVAGDKVLYTKLADDAQISGLVPGTEYFVQSATGSKIKLSPDDTLATVIQIAAGVTGDSYKLTIDVQKAWNTIAGTTSGTYAVGDLFEANADGSGISNGIAKLAFFIATDQGNVGSSGATAYSVNPPGLYIYNSMTDGANRAFSGRDNPWEEEQVTIGLDTGQTGTAPSFNALKTESDVAQVRDFRFERDDETSYGGFSTGENYTIASLGDGNRDWTLVGWTANQYGNGASPAVGDVFTATDSGNGHVGSAGAAIGEPKFLFLQSNQGTQDGDGLDDFDSTKQISGNTITHKIPIVVNGETYFLLANSTEADVAAGNYKVLATPA